MKPLTCDITDDIRSDFGELWKCQQRGQSIEISTPYLLPDSTLLTLFLTLRDERIIVTDGGSILEVLSECSPMPDDEILSTLEGYAQKFDIKSCPGGNGAPLMFYIDTSDRALVSSLCFDLASFAVAVSNRLITISPREEERSPKDQRFYQRADEYIGSIISSSQRMSSRKEIEEVPGVRFSCVVQSPAKVWLISYITGEEFSYYKRSVGEAAQNFRCARKSRIAEMMQTIPLLDDAANGFKPERLKLQIADLSESAGTAPVIWRHKEELRDILRAG